MATDIKGTLKNTANDSNRMTKWKKKKTTKKDLWALSADKDVGHVAFAYITGRNTK